MQISNVNGTSRVIRRYANRRLYDIEASRYINFSDLRQYVLDGISFRVVVEKTNEDQTKSILMQIFLDLEMSGQPLFSNQSLMNIIVMRSAFTNDTFTNYLDSWLRAMTQINKNI